MMNKINKEYYLALPLAEKKAIVQEEISELKLEVMLAGSLDRLHFEIIVYIPLSASDSPKKYEKQSHCPLGTLQHELSDLMCDMRWKASTWDDEYRNLIISQIQNAIPEAVIISEQDELVGHMMASYEHGAIGHDTMYGHGPLWILFPICE